MKTENAERVQTKPFDETAWLMFPGTEAPEGKEPLIGEIKVGQREGFVTVAEDGVHVYILQEETGVTDFYFFKINFEAGKLLAGALDRETSDQILVGILQFTKLAI